MRSAVRRVLSLALASLSVLTLVSVIAPSPALAQTMQVPVQGEGDSTTVVALSGEELKALQGFLTKNRVGSDPRVGVIYVNAAFTTTSPALNTGCVRVGPMPGLDPGLENFHVIYACLVTQSLPQVDRDSWSDGSGGNVVTPGQFSRDRVDSATKDEIEAQGGTCTRAEVFDLNDPPFWNCYSADADNLSTAPTVQVPVRQYEPHTFLPAWRWRQHTDLLSAPGFFDGAINGPINALAGLLFIIAGWIWGALLFILREATSLDVLAENASMINRGFAQMADALITSGAWAVVMLFALFVASRLILKGRVTQVFSMALGVILPIALLFAMTSASLNAPRDRSGLPVGSPAWVGVTGVKMVDQVGNAAAGGLLRVNSLGASSQVRGGTVCDAYRYHLGELEKQRIAASGLEPMDANSMLLVSRMWETSFLNSWKAAQYGSVEAGSLMYCFDLEARLAVPPFEQARILNEATQGRLNFSENVFQDTYADDTDSRARIYMFAACRPDPAAGTVASQPGWAALGGPNQQACEDWVRSGKATGLNWSTTRVLNGARSSSLNNADVTFAYNTVRATWGHNGGQRITEGIMSVLAAAVYLYALGGVAVGAILAQYGLFIMLILLPVTLTLVALPSSSGGRNPTGVRMLKMTGGFFFAKMALTLVLSLLVVTSTLLGSLLPSHAGGQLGVGSMITLAHAFVPLASLFMVRKLLTTLGLGDITKLSGAVGLSAATSAAATGDSRLRSSMQRGMEGSRASKMLSRADARFKKAVSDRTTAKAAAAAQRKVAAGKAAGKEAWRKSGTRGKLDPLLGRRDEDGNVVAESAFARGKASVRAARAAALAGSLGWATGAGKGEESRGSIQKALSRSKVARQAYENSLSRSLSAKESHGLMRQRAQSLKEENKAVWRLTDSERPAALSALVDQRIERAAQANLSSMGIKAKESGLYNAEDRQAMVDSVMNTHGIRNREAVAAHIMTSEEGTVPLFLSGQGRRGPNGSVIGRFEGMKMSPSELYSVLSTNPEMMFDPQIQQRRPGESESQHHARLLALSIAAGYRDADGTPTNFLEMNGMTREQAERELAKSLQGQESKLDFMSARIDPQAMSQVEAGMLARQATNRQTGAVAAGDKLVQLAESKKGLEGLGSAVSDVNTAVMNVTSNLSSSGDASELLASMDAIVRVGKGAYEQAASVTLAAEVYKQDVEGKQNLAEVIAQAEHVVAPLERAKADLELRFAPLREMVEKELAPAQQVVANYQAAREALNKNLAELTSDSDRAELEEQLAKLEQDHREAKDKVAASMATLKTEMSIIGKSHVGRLAKDIGQARSSAEESMRRAESRYEAEAGASSRNSTPAPAPSRFAMTVPAPLP